jgi:hypothetical protein
LSGVVSLFFPVKKKWPPALILTWFTEIVVGVAVTVNHQFNVTALYVMTVLSCTAA